MAFATDTMDGHGHTAVVTKNTVNVYQKDKDVTALDIRLVVGGSEKLVARWNTLAIKSVGIT